MIRSILLIQFKPDATDAQIDAFGRALAEVPFAGRHHFGFHRSTRFDGDPGDSMDAMVVSDFDDEDVYKAWVADPGHHRVRSEFLDPIRERRDRFLYQV